MSRAKSEIEEIIANASQRFMTEYVRMPVIENDVIPVDGKRYRSGEIVTHVADWFDTPMIACFPDEIIPCSVRIEIIDGQFLIACVRPKPVEPIETSELNFMKGYFDHQFQSYHMQGARNIQLGTLSEKLIQFPAIQCVSEPHMPYGLVSEVQDHLLDALKSIEEDL